MHTPDIAGSQLALWCKTWLRSLPAETLFTTGHLSSVTGLRLEDGREVVVKVRPGSRRLLGCTFVHRHLHAAGFPCPRPLAGPSPLAGYAANAELLVPGGDLTPGAADPAERYAALLADLVRLAPDPADPPTLADPPPWTAADHGFPGVWPPADDRPEDLNASDAAPWLDDVARRVREALLTVGDPPVVGHGDFYAENIRWRDGLPYAVHDWDSVIAAPESTVAGLAAAVWPVSRTPDGGWVQAATIDETAAFLDAYQRARGRVWTPEQSRSAWAAGLWVLAFNAKKASLDRPVEAGCHDDFTERLRRAGL